MLLIDFDRDEAVELGTRRPRCGYDYLYGAKVRGNLKRRAPLAMEAEETTPSQVEASTKSADGADVVHGESRTSKYLLVGYAACRWID